MENKVNNRITANNFKGEFQMKQTAEGPSDRVGKRRLSLRRSSHAFCPVCEKQVELISFADAATLFHTDLQDIQFLTNKGDVHQVHNRTGKVMACSPALFDCFENRKTRLLDSGILKEIAAAKSA
jgi:hypothetical protein